MAQLNNVTPNSNNIEDCISKPSIPGAQPRPKDQGGYREAKPKVTTKALLVSFLPVKAAPNVPIMLKAGVPSNNDITKNKTLIFCKPSKIPRKGDIKTSGKPVVNQWTRLWPSQHPPMARVKSLTNLMFHLQNLKQKYVQEIKGRPKELLSIMFREPL